MDDRHGEPYFKLMFVAFLKGATLTQDIRQREIDGRTINLPKAKPPIQCSIEALTYHYIGGVKHLKTIDGQYLSTNRNFPKLQDAHKPVLICRYTLDKFSGHTEPILGAAEEDIVIENVEIPCCIEFFVSYKKASDERHKFIKHLDGDNHYLVSSVDERTALTVTLMHYDNPHPTLSSGLLNNEDPYIWQKGIAWYSKPIFKIKKYLARKYPRIFKNWP